jgi:hypothetical protein
VGALFKKEEKMVLIAEEIFNDGQFDRNAYPYTQGALYKLKERSRYFKDYSRTVERLMLYSHRRSGSTLCGRCTWAERRYWLRKILLSIPYCLGHDLSPAVETLGLNGLSQSEIDYLRRHVNQTVAGLLVEVDHVYNQVNQSMSAEYKEWKKGRSLIKRLLDETGALADEVTQYCKDRKPLHGVNEESSSEQTKRSFEAERRP